MFCLLSFDFLLKNAQVLDGFGADSFTIRCCQINSRSEIQIVFPEVRHQKGSADRPIDIIRYPSLPKDENYIFAAGHSFPGEIASNLAVIDRKVWPLIGTTDQIDHNPQMLIGWINGMMYVDKFSAESRRESMKKMKRILQAGSSVLLFPEGVLNNSENLLCMPVYPGFYHLSLETGEKVIPIVSQAEHGAERILVAAGDPMSFEGMNKNEAMDALRDALATLRFELIERLPVLERKTISGDIHLKHLQKRHDTYLETKWIEPNWDEEIMMYHRKGITSPEEVRASFDNVQVTEDNAGILAPVLLRREQDIRYDIRRYMKAHWQEKLIPPRDGSGW